MIEDPNRLLPQIEFTSEHCVSILDMIFSKDKNLIERHS